MTVGFPFDQIGYVKDLTAMSDDEDFPAFFEKRPWGMFLCFGQNLNCTAKVLSISPDEMLSGQIHERRDQLYLVHGIGMMAWSDRPVPVELESPEEVHAWWMAGHYKSTVTKPGDIFWFPRRVIHRPAALNEGLIITEVAYGENDEEDILRIVDKYGRNGDANQEG